MLKTNTKLHLAKHNQQLRKQLFPNLDCVCAEEELMRAYRESLMESEAIMTLWTIIARLADPLLEAQ